jgi:carboxylesterase type B
LQIKTDQVFWHGLQRTIQGRQNSGGSGKTFVYRFGVDSATQNHFRIRRLGPDVRGVCHADDISYLFKNIFGGVPAEGSVELKTIQRFVRHFIALPNAF